MATPSGSAVLLGFAELNQTMNGPFIGISGAPIVTIANVFAVSRLKDTDVPHHSRDTENYATDTEHTAQLGVMTNPKDQFVVFITAVLLFGNVMLRL